MCDRPFETGREEITIIVGDPRRSKFRSFDRSFVVRETQSQGKFIRRIPFESESVTKSVIVIDIENAGRRGSILEDNGNGLQPAPMRPGKIAHDGKMMGEALVNAEMQDIGQVES